MAIRLVQIEVRSNKRKEFSCFKRWQGSSKDSKRHKFYKKMRNRWIRKFKMTEIPPLKFYKTWEY